MISTILLDILTGMAVLIVSGIAVVLIVEIQKAIFNSGSYIANGLYAITSCGLFFWLLNELGVTHRKTITITGIIMIILMVIVLLGTYKQRIKLKKNEQTY